MKASHAFDAPGAFKAAARPLCAGAICRRARGDVRDRNASTEAKTERPAESFFEQLTEGPYFVIGLMLDCKSLCFMDAACRSMLVLNNANVHVGPWRALGARTYRSLELENDGVFEQPVLGMELQKNDLGSRKFARIDWKGRFRRFRAEVATFVAPFGGSTITGVAKPDEVAYFRSRLCTDAEHMSSPQGVYLEVDVIQNPDNLSLALVDFEAGGCSSITFSPDTGAVIRERKVREVPRKVEGAYIQSLTSVPPGQRFRGRIGLFLHRGRLSFFRRCVADMLNPPQAADANEDASWVGNALASESRDVDENGLGPWEATGFISDISWAEGRLTPCLAFRDEGDYQVAIVNIGTQPPLPIQDWSAEDDKTIGWSGFDWEVGPLTPGAEGNDLPTE